MHFSAKRGLAIACCLSVTLVDCDHIGWNSSKIISPLVSLGCSLSADPNIRGLLQEEHPEIWAQNDPPPVDLSIGDIRSQIAAKWLQIAQRSQWRASLFSFEWYHRWLPTTSPFPQNGGSICPKIHEWPYLRNRWSDTPCLVLVYGFQGRWIEWHYFRLYQIQVGNRPPSWIISTCKIVARITYTVLVETLNTAQSITDFLYHFVSLFKSCTIKTKGSRNY